MAKKTDGTLKIAATIAFAIFLLAFFVLFFPGDYRFIPAFFLALLIAMLSGIVVYLSFGGGKSKSAGVHAGAPSSSVAAGTATTAAAATGTAASGAASSAKADAERQAAEDAAARKAAEDEAARKAAEEEAARKTAEAEAAQKAAEEEAARKASQKAAAASAIGSAGASGAQMSEDYDGDGVPEGADEGKRPAGLAAPRDGKADDLKQIKGVGPKLEQLCNSLGFWHFDQVAAWTSDEVAWVDANLTGFKGRVSRDDWVGQAKVLASGGATEFSKRVKGGDVY